MNPMDCNGERPIQERHGGGDAVLCSSLLISTTLLPAHFDSIADPQRNVS